MKQLILTIVSPAELPSPEQRSWLDFFKRPIPWVADDRTDYLHAFTAISCKFSYKDQVNGKTFYKPYPGALIDSADCERHAWEYLVYRNEDEARAVGTKMGKLCYEHRIKVFWANQEAGMAGTEPYAKIATPYKNHKVFIESFRRAAPSYTKLGYNGFSWMRTSDGRPLHDSALIKLYDFWCPMNYGTSSSTVEDYWQDKCFKYSKTAPNVPVIPMIGVGRVDSAGSVWGNWTTHKRLLLSSKVEGVNFFFGNGAKNQMLIGHKQHGPLVQCALELREAWGDC